MSQRVLAYFRKRWFLTVLLTFLVVGTWQAERLEFLTQVGLIRSGIVAAVLFLMALPLEARAIWRVIRRPTAPLLASALNLGLLPLVAWGIGLLLSSEMRLGLAVAAATPCTLASAAVWTRRAGGDDATALMTTVITNLVCFVVTPAWLAVTTGHSFSGGGLTLAALVTSLGLLVVLPMVIAQSLRPIAGIGAWATRRAGPIGVVAQWGVLTMVLFGAIKTGLTLRAGAGAGLIGELGAMLAAVVAIHLLVLGVGVTLARWLGLSPEERIAVGFAGSQKTLMVGLQAGLALGITILPMVAYHVSQLLIDAWIADRVRDRGAGRDA